MDPEINKTLLAQAEKPLGWFKGIGPLGEAENWTKSGLLGPSYRFAQVISIAIGTMTIIAFIWFIFTLFTGALAWITSGGDKVKVQNAQKQISNGLIGVVIVISAIFLFRLFGNIIGIESLSIFDLLNSLWQD